VLPAITPRFIPSCTDELLYGLGAMARDTGLHVQTHCAESDWEVRHVRARTGLTDAEALDGFGLLTDRTILAHSVHLTDDDMGLLAHRGSAVAHCPLSNAYFADAVFPMRRAWAHGVRTGLGSDISGGYDPTMTGVMRHALSASRQACSGTDPLVPRANRGPGGAPLTSAEAFWLATAGGGEALGLPVGMFRPGHAFDALSIRVPHTWPGLDDPVHQLDRILLTSAPCDIQTVWTAGVRRGAERRHPEALPCADGSVDCKS
jgi:guanine deaminase